MADTTQGDNWGQKEFVTSSKPDFEPKPTVWIPYTGPKPTAEEIRDGKAARRYQRKLWERTRGD